MKTLLSAVSALALVVGASQAFAQGAPSGGAASCPPGQTCPPTGATGGAQGGASGGAATQQGGTRQQGSGSTSGGATTGSGSTGAAGSAQGGASGGTTTQQGGSTSGAAQGTTSGSGTTSGTAQGTTSGSGSTTTQAPSGGNTNVNVNITTEQRTTIRQTIVAEKVQPVANVSFTIAVGTVVPRTVTLRRLPARIVTIVPAWADYEFFLLPDGRIVIVEPATLKIVVILAA